MLVDIMKRDFPYIVSNILCTDGDKVTAIETF